MTAFNTILRLRPARRRSSSPAAETVIGPDRERFAISDVPRVSSFVARALRGMGARTPDDELKLLQTLSASAFSREAMTERLASIDNADILDDAMRRLRREVMVTVAVRDIAGLADFHEVVETMTALAEETLTAAVRVNARALAARFACRAMKRGSRRIFSSSVWKAGRCGVECVV